MISKRPAQHIKILKRRRNTTYLKIQKLSSWQNTSSPFPPSRKQWLYLSFLRNTIVEILCVWTWHLFCCRVTYVKLSENALDCVNQSPPRTHTHYFQTFVHCEMLRISVVIWRWLQWFLWLKICKAGLNMLFCSSVSLLQLLFRKKNISTLHTNRGLCCLFF